MEKPSNTIEERKRILNEYCNKEIIKNKYIKEFAQLNDTLNAPNNIEKNNNFSSSNNILIYTGYMNFLWNDSTLDNGVLGGSEKAVIYLSRYLPKNYNIYIAGDQQEEIKGNITYIHNTKLQHFLNNTTFHSIIVSRYISFLKQFNNIKCYQLFISAHDTHFINVPITNCYVPYFSTNDILQQYNKYIDNAICLSEWHANHIIKQHNFLSNKIKIINNGINISDFTNTFSSEFDGIFKDDKTTKIKNTFIWSSCAGRGITYSTKFMG